MHLRALLNLLTVMMAGPYRNEKSHMGLLSRMSYLLQFLTNLSVSAWYSGLVVGLPCNGVADARVAVFTEQPEHNNERFDPTFEQSSLTVFHGSLKDERSSFDPTIYEDDAHSITPGSNGRRLSPLIQSPKTVLGFGHVLLLIGSLITGSAIWRKTSELYHSPLQALRKIKMRILGQVPPSWDSYIASLPVLNIKKHRELHPLMHRLEKKPLVVMCIPRPTKHLASVLGLTENQRYEGIVIKAKSTVDLTAKEAAFELFAHQHLAKGIPLTLPSLGVYRDIGSNTLFLVTPRARADVAQYTRRMPEKVNVRVAWAEMIWSLWGMHRRGWVHRDIKSFNYFVSQAGQAVLGDFEGYWRDGLHAVIFGDEVEILFTDRYVAPEMKFDSEYQMFDCKTDVYALGVTFQEMLKWMEGIRIPNLDTAKDLVMHMLDPEPTQRFDLEKCMEHKYFKGINFGDLEKSNYGKAFEGNYFTPYTFLEGH